MKHKAQDPLIVLVQTLDDGIEFYRIAEQKTRSPELQRVFARMADVREFALAYVRPYLDMHDHELEKALTYYGSLANRYAPLMDRIVADERLLVVQQVEEHLIDAMIHAEGETHNALVQYVLTELVPHITDNFDAAQAALPTSAMTERQVAA